MFVFVGTAKGLFRFQSDDRAIWRALEPVLTGDPVYTSAFNPANGILYAGVNSEFYGPSIRRSKDFGETWDNGGTGLEYGADDVERVTRVWSIYPVNSDVVYAGVEASGLFRTDDGGDSWAEVKALREHPTHETWEPGYGGKCLHTIAVDPFHPNRIFIACSSGGIYRSEDEGADWAPINTGIRAEFFPEGQQFPESGQCVHKFCVSSALEGRMWLQNHGGVYRSDNYGDTWIYVGSELPSDFGFPIVVHPKQADEAYVIPLQRWPRWSPDHEMTVYRTKDGGTRWDRLQRGLPEAYSGVLRDAFTGDGQNPFGLYFGTTSGGLFHSSDEGATWHVIAEHLPRIHSVVAVDEG